MAQSTEKAKEMTKSFFGTDKDVKVHVVDLTDLTDDELL
jgi:hypothetical protein